MMTPTDELYDELQQAYSFFNDHLFDSELPGCLFTLQRKQNTFGFYSSSQFLRRDAKGKTDEIALNPAFFAFRSVEKTLSTLVHEMVHQWQAHFGKRSRSGYHNKEWADKMESVGLMPSHTGEPGGNRVGQQMTHYIIEGGPFDRGCQALIRGGGIISWVDVAAKRVPMSITALLGPHGEPAAGPEGGEVPGIDVAALTALGLQPVDPGQNKKLKVKYTCPACGVNVWGKSGLSVSCNDCERAFEEQPGRGKQPVPTIEGD
ncbi:SprT-like domain-containing protein [Burkholderia pseudomallei]|uniref:SprT-like domain-containing protein n=1 Tax=Burkholderia pseudomallei TaxID=28450 RepID=UPI000F05B874|nr:SprT-like domain-containing protein [Burkholderia pseudomallei]